MLPPVPGIWGSGKASANPEDFLAHRITLTIAHTPKPANTTPLTRLIITLRSASTFVNICAPALKISHQSSDPAAIPAANNSGLKQCTLVINVAKVKIAIGFVMANTKIVAPLRNASPDPRSGTGFCSPLCQLPHAIQSKTRPPTTPITRLYPAVTLTPSAAAIAKHKSANATPAPLATPALHPIASVRRNTTIPTGPIGAATRNPIHMPIANAFIMALS